MSNLKSADVMVIITKTYGIGITVEWEEIEGETFDIREAAIESARAAPDEELTEISSSEAVIEAYVPKE